MRSFLANRLRIAAVSLLCSAVLASPVSASPSPRDAAASHAYLQAKLAERHELFALHGKGAQALEALARGVQSECPRVLAARAQRGPQPRQTETSGAKINAELVYALSLPYMRVTHSARARFDRRVRHLLWSDDQLTRLVHWLSRQQLRQSALPLPQLCADMRFWIASGFTHTSPQTRRFDREVTQVFSAVETKSPPVEADGREFVDVDAFIAYRLKRYESPGDQTLASRIMQPGPKRSNALHARRFNAAAKKLLKALGLPTGLGFLHFQ